MRGKTPDQDIAAKINGLYRTRFPILAALFAVFAMSGIVNAIIVFEYEAFPELLQGIGQLASAIMSAVVCFALWRGEKWTYKALLAYFLLGLFALAYIAYAMLNVPVPASMFLFVVYVGITGSVVYYVYNKARKAFME